MDSLLLGVGDPNTNPREEDVVKFANFFYFVMYQAGCGGATLHVQLLPEIIIIKKK